MDGKEARAVAGIASTADGDCYICAARLFVQLEKRFPEHPWARWYGEILGTTATPEEALND